MKKHLYFYSSDPFQTKDLRNDDMFESTPEYDHYDLARTFPNEYGRIKTDQNYYHLLIGRLTQKNCPWCGFTPELLKVYDDKMLNRSGYCIECKQCRSRGPVLNVDKAMELNEHMMEHCIELLWNRYNHRRAWDADFVHPYGER